MCYRPANAATALKCIECGGFNKPDNEVCQKCGADLEASREAAASGAAAGAPAVGAPGAPGAPRPMAGPGAPKPAAPTAPKAPTA
ncbi:MAG: hypothetical protein PUD81_00915 [Eggerthellales bacterium]|nr:hypothetical protein [Eggerthellales bacterium]